MEVWQYGKRIVRSTLSPPPTSIATLAGQALFPESQASAIAPGTGTLLRVASPGNYDMHADAPGASHMKEPQGCGRLGWV